MMVTKLDQTLLQNKMTPIKLTGKTLGERHRCLNAAVNEAFKSKQEFDSFEDIPEYSPLDRIFKINLASKLRVTDYVIQNLKDDYMLYVSKALRCKWLIETEHKDIINPVYLEKCLYPTMITPAVTKMKHWIYINLKNPERCQTFFNYYCEIDFKHAVKYLRNCSAYFIKEQISSHLLKLSPNNLKILCENNPLIAKMFFDAILIDEDIKSMYLLKEKQYFNILKSLVKSDGMMVLDIVEKYFNKLKMKPFNPKATKYIMTYYRDRFILKQELYTAFLLNLQTLASCLNAEEAINLLMALSKDNYLLSEKWFSYQKVEPLIKRIKPDDRGAIKKKLFADKNIKTTVQKWSYEIPTPPLPSPKILPIFVDYEHDPDKYEELEIDFRAMLKKRKYCKWTERQSSTKTLLDKLFDEYRVASYDKVLFELRKKIKSESSPQNRQYIMLVLVSKSGGHDNNLDSLMRLLSEYKNEPAQLRAAVVRSLVKRASVWRAPDHTWKLLLEFSHGLGLDGKPPEAECIEGIHAVVIRQLLTHGICDSEVMTLYLNNFSTLYDYPFMKSEKDNIAIYLPKILFAKVCEETEVDCSVNMINKLLDTLTKYNLPIEKYPGLVSKIQSYAKNNISKFADILKRLFSSHVGRRELFEVNFEIINTKDSYLNALRHNIDVISVQKLIQLLVHTSKFDNTFFFRKISIYFNEKEGLANKFLDVLKTEQFNINLSKPLALLLGDQLISFTQHIDTLIYDKKDKLFAAAMRTYLHLARPAINIDQFGWSAIGTKAIATKVSVCRETEIDKYIQKLLENKRTLKLANLLAKRSNNYFEFFEGLIKIKPTLGLKLGIKLLIRNDNVLIDEAKIWNVIKPLVYNLNIDSKQKLKLPEVSSFPISLRTDYILILYKIYRKNSFYKSMPFLCHIENVLPTIPDEMLQNVLVEYLNEGLSELEVQLKEKYRDSFGVDCHRLYLRIIIKYLLLCKTEEEQSKRYDRIGAVFFDKMKTWLHSDENKNRWRTYLNDILTSFRYYKVFLNNEYISCLPIMKKVITWMKTNIPIEKNFKAFVHMHLNMLYYTAIRESISILPKQHFEDNDQTEARSVVGYIFGKYLAREMNTLKTAYFSSVQYLYKDILLSLDDYFLHPCEVFTQCLIEGVLEPSADTDAALAVYLVRRSRRFLGDTALQQILLTCKKCENIEFQMIFFGETY